MSITAALEKKHDSQIKTSRFVEKSSLLKLVFPESAADPIQLVFLK